MREISTKMVLNVTLPILLYQDGSKLYLFATSTPLKAFKGKCEIWQY